MGENVEGVLRQRDKVKITDQSVVLFKQKRSFKNKNKRPRCIKVGNGPLNPCSGNDMSKMSFQRYPEIKRNSSYRI